MRAPRNSIVARGLLFTLAALALVWPEAAHADEPAPVVTYDPTAFPSREAQMRTITYGAVMTLGSYGAAVGASYLWSNDFGANDLRIPVVGPWMKLGQTRLCPPPNENEISTCSDVTQVAGAVLVAVDGLLQAGGLFLLLEGLLMKTSGAQPSALRSTPTTMKLSHPLTLELGDVKMRPTTLAVPSATASLGLSGTF